MIFLHHDAMTQDRTSFSNGVLKKTFTFHVNIGLYRDRLSGRRIPEVNRVRAGLDMEAGFRVFMVFMAFFLS